MIQQPLWNSLEVAKLLVGALTPLMVLVLGLWINRRLKRIEHLQWTNQKVIEKRLSVFEELAPLLNDILCYFTYVGCWKDLTPPEMVKLKRRLDKIVYVNAPLFSEQFLTTYSKFVHACYEVFAAWGEDAKLRTQTERRKEAAAKTGSTWDDSWDNCFSDEDDGPDADQIQAVYQDLMACFAREIGIGLDVKTYPVGVLPANIR